MVASLSFSLYMLLDPGVWLVNLMQLTELSLGFKAFTVILGLGGFTLAWFAEKSVFVWLARMLGRTHDAVWAKYPRKQYKIILEDMRI